MSQAASGQLNDLKEKIKDVRFGMFTTLDPDGKRIYMGTAVGTATGKTSTATGSITLTGTFTGFGGGMINYPFAQGAIT